MEEIEKRVTLRDLFAMAAMSAILTKLPTVDQDGEFGDPVLNKVQYNRDIADSAFEFAEAMMERREQR